ncbi:hypothetical protein MCOR24_000855 [Pyricularia oryzae]|nr:hypothetical protein MCOR24_000855 [Pyricularia oryzae]
MISQVINMAPSVLSTVSLLAAFASAAVAGGNTDVAQKPLLSYFECEHPAYKIQVVSKSPLVIYIHNFITPTERQHLQDVTKNTLTHSGVTANDGQGNTVQESQERSSQSTNVPRDAVVRCIEDRALAFQGHDVARSQLEPLQLVKYGQGQGQGHHFHTDWFADVAQHATAALGGNRLSSFFAYVDVSNSTEGNGDETIVGGGTNFPMLDAPRDERWCAVLDCDEPWANGVTFRPIAGNAVYWENMLPTGAGGDHRTLHAVLPLIKGSKIGMNIWTRQGSMSDDVRGPDV